MSGDDEVLALNQLQTMKIVGEIPTTIRGGLGDVGYALNITCAFLVISQARGGALLSALSTVTTIESRSFVSKNTKPKLGKRGRKETVRECLK